MSSVGRYSGRRRSTRRLRRSGYPVTYQWLVIDQLRHCSGSYWPQLPSDHYVTSGQPQTVCERSVRRWQALAWTWLQKTAEHLGQYSRYAAWFCVRLRASSYYVAYYCSLTSVPCRVNVFSSSQYYKNYYTLHTHWRIQRGLGVHGPQTSDDFFCLTKTDFRTNWPTLWAVQI